MTQSVPPLLNYQGRLTDEAGGPLTDGTYGLAFRLYNSAIPAPEEELIWGAEYDVTLLGGAFNVVLGASGGIAIAERAVNELTYAFTEPSRFLELRVLRNAEGVAMDRTVLPRQQLLSAPFAIMAGNGVPPGTIMAFGGEVVPDGWLLCDGRAVSRDDHAKLFDAIGVAWGHGNGSTTFRIPDLRGRFLRGVSGDSSLDPSRTVRSAIYEGGNTGNRVGSVQGDTTKRPHTPFRTDTAGAHTHSISGPAAHDDAGSTDTHFALGDANFARPFPPLTVGTAGSHSHAINSGGDVETRPINVYVNYIIKY